MKIETTGIHHVTSIAGDPQENVDFYTDVLGLRLVKQTVNFDDKFTYHLYYGDRIGNPGTILTFFPVIGARQGQVGRAQASATAFLIPEGSDDYWIERLQADGVGIDTTDARYDETVIRFRDHDGQPLELITGSSEIEPWADGPVPDEHGIRGFHSVTLDSLEPEETGEILRTLGFVRTDTGEDRTQFRVDGDHGATVDIRDRSESRRGRQGVGTVHHIAFRVPDERNQMKWRDHLLDLGYHVTPQKDRQYFKSVYFREPGGILFEIATDGPGFTRDESEAELGRTLKLPPWLENEREMIEGQLPKIELDRMNG